MAQNELRAYPAALATLAGGTLETAKQMARAQLDAQAELTVPPSALGNSVAAPEFHGEHQALVEAADGVCEAIVSTLEADTDNLYRVTFAYQREDEEAARRIRQAGGKP